MRVRGWFRGGVGQGYRRVKGQLDEVRGELVEVKKIMWTHYTQIKG